MTGKYGWSLDSWVGDLRFHVVWDGGLKIGLAGHWLVRAVNVLLVVNVSGDLSTGQDRDEGCVQRGSAVRVRGG